MCVYLFSFLIFHGSLAVVDDYVEAAVKHRHISRGHTRNTSGRCAMLRQSLI